MVTIDNEKASLSSEEAQSLLKGQKLPKDVYLHGGIRIYMEKTSMRQGMKESDLISISVHKSKSIHYISAIKIRSEITIYCRQ